MTFPLPLNISISRRATNNQCFTYRKREIIQSGSRKTGPPSRRTTWAQVSDSVQEIKQMQSTYWLEKVLKMISLYVNALLCTLKHIVIHAMQLGGVNSEKKGKDKSNTCVVIQDSQGCLCKRMRSIQTTHLKKNRLHIQIQAQNKPVYIVSL